MPLKYKFKTKEEIPAEHLPLYAEREGAWVLDVEGAVEKSKLDEFRNTNVALLKERDDLKKRFEGLDPDAVKALADETDEKRQPELDRLDQVAQRNGEGVSTENLDRLWALLRAEIHKVCLNPPCGACHRGRGTLKTAPFLPHFCIMGAIVRCFPESLPGFSRPQPNAKSERTQNEIGKETVKKW